MKRSGSNNNINKNNNDTMAPAKTTTIITNSNDNTTSRTGFDTGNNLNSDIIDDNDNHYNTGNNNNSTTLEKQWTVRVFRCRYDMTNTNDNTNNHLHLNNKKSVTHDSNRYKYQYDKVAMNHNHNQTMKYKYTHTCTWQRLRAYNNRTKKYYKVKACPRYGCIVLKRIQVRLRLGNTTTNDANTINGTSNEIHNNNSKSTVTIIRRYDRILITSSTSSSSSNLSLPSSISTIPNRTLVLQFESESDCLSFSDKLQQLNPSPVTTGSTISDTSTTNRNNSTGSMIKNYNYSPTGTSNSNNNTSTDTDTNIASYQYITQLLCDDDFCNFVSQLEVSLLQQPVVHDSPSSIHTVVDASTLSSLLSHPCSTTSTGTTRSTDGNTFLLDALVHDTI